MKRHLNHWSVLFPALLVMGLSNPSWAHFHGGFGIYLGPGPYWGPGPYYDPYYDYPYPYDDSYRYDPNVYVPSDDSRQDLTFLERQVARTREEIYYDYEDGDITKEQRKTALHNLKQILDETYAEAKANGGYITGRQEKEFLNEIRYGPRQSRSTVQAFPPQAPSREMAAIHDQITQLRNMLDKKLAEGNITKAQHDGMEDYLTRTEKQARSQALANDGSLTPAQAEAAREQLERVERSIQGNLIAH